MKEGTHRFRSVAAALEKLEFGDLIVDGEVVVLGPDGRSDFQALQNVLHQGGNAALIYILFDLLYHQGNDLRQVALIDRKQLLCEWLKRNNQTSIIRYNDHIAGEGEGVFAAACRLGLEGIVAKRVDSHYREKRTTDWVKVKCRKRQEFVIGGWTEPGGGRESLGALLVGYYCIPRSLCIAAVSAPVSRESRSANFTRPFVRSNRSGRHFESHRPASPRRRDPWVKPKVVAEVEFAEWTDEGLLRQASYTGTREDKEPTEISREMPVEPGFQGPNSHRSQRDRSKFALMKPARKTNRKKYRNRRTFSMVFESLIPTAFFFLKRILPSEIWLLITRRSLLLSCPTLWADRSRWCVVPRD